MRKRMALIYKLLNELTEEFSLPADLQSMQRYQIASVAERAGLLQNNVSSDLNELFLGGHLLKIKGRPVYYLALERLEKRLGIVMPTNQIEGLGSFCALIQPEQLNRDVYPAQSELLDAAAQSDMDTLVGAGRSLQLQTRQAKSAILYPSGGLHTLITGQTGTGKSSFAQSMYDFAVKSHRLSSEAAFVTLNCANYADNPQLLLSQLFGHAKGSFTGADKDHAGLVEYADNGILFFDEIHRLSAEGQEKLFVLMDRGVYSRLGETGKERRAKVLILGATTENPDNAMLSTFLRRIPVHITLPPLCERSVLERLELVFFFLWKEARVMKMRLTAAKELIFALCYYECAANIGQLSNDIKLTCANAYYDYLTGRNKSMRIEISHLDEKARQGLFTASNGRNEALEPLLRDHGQQPITFDGSLAFAEILDRYAIHDHG